MKSPSAATSPALCSDSMSSDCAIFLGIRVLLLQY